MTDPHSEPDSSTAEPQGTVATPEKKPISMHEGVPVWHDCCCCEAEPYWIAVAEEMGIDLDAGWDGDKHTP